MSDAEEGLGTLRPGGGAPRAHGHLDGGVGPALGRGAGQVVDVGVTPEALFGLGPVGREEHVGEALVLFGEDGPADDVEVHLAQIAVGARDQVGVTAGLFGQGGGIGAVLVGQLLPVGHHGAKGGELHVDAGL